tara:strand:+ start:5818 stop:6816 length:999 start_codon:yes stop_codon:yes gene_type:complete
MKLHGKYGMIDPSLFENKNILVTGSSGLLGSWLVEDLLNMGCNVTGIAIDETKDDLLKSKNIFDKIEKFYIDVSSYKEIEKIILDKKFTFIFHLAAQTQVTEALLNPLRTLESNIKGTWNLLEISRLENIPMVLASSDKAYGTSDKLPYQENFALNGEFPYEVSKSASDLITTMYANTYNINVATLRCGNIYGGGDLNWDRLIPGVIKHLIIGEIPILRTKGNFKREWVYVKDVVNAYIATADAVMKNKNKFIAYNFASGETKSVMEVYEIISTLVVGKIIKPKIQLDSEFEIKDQQLDSSRIKNDLGIESKFTFEESILETIEWYKSNLNQ